MELATAQAHHVRDVLRLREGDGLELFDDAGAVGRGVIVLCSSASVRVDVREMSVAGPDETIELSIAAAVPKGNRADWMIEKLSELGAARFIPLRTERSVVLPEGKNKMERWSRLAREAARQSRRRGVMDIEALTGVGELIGRESADTDSLAMWHLSTQPQVPPMASLALPSRLLLLIGPEGGWSDGEIVLFAEQSVQGVGLTATVLRVETAAVAAAAVAMCRR
jgi:16S rRNA (uracil1498-N3)-methyltransferase